MRHWAAILNLAKGDSLIPTIESFSEANGLQGTISMGYVLFIVTEWLLDSSIHEPTFVLLHFLVQVICEVSDFPL